MTRDVKLTVGGRQNFEILTSLSPFS